MCSEYTIANHVKPLKSASHQNGYSEQYISIDLLKPFPKPKISLRL